MRIDNGQKQRYRMNPETKDVGQFGNGRGWRHAGHLDLAFPRYKVYMVEKAPVRRQNGSARQNFPYQRLLNVHRFTKAGCGGAP
jgi:hypothetical protein